MIIRNLGLQDYTDTWQNMQRYTQERTNDSHDQLWVVEHNPVYTLGLNGKREHLLNIGNIPVVQSDRGGQVTYHGLGQLVVYILFDIKRLQLNIRELVTLLESSMIKTLAEYDILARSRTDAPGVYVEGKKIGSIGLRIKNNCSYHGLSLNNNMNLQPFDRINTCGYSDLKVTQLSDLGVNISTDELANSLVRTITTTLSK